jgi:HK97 family phage major capsid protein
MAINIAELKQEKNALVVRAREIHERAESEKRALGQEERNNYEQLVKDAVAVQERIGREEQLLALASVAAGGDGQRAFATAPQGGDLQEDADVPSELKRRGSKEYERAFRSWLRGGVAELAPTEQRALSSVDANGGFFMTPTQVVDKLIVAINARVFVRNWATKLQIADGSKSLGVPTIATDISDPDWTAEVAAITEDTALAFGRRELTPYMLTKRIKVSMKLLRSIPSVDSVVVDRLAYKMGVAMEKAYMTGAGSTGPLGVFIASNDGIPTGSDVTAAGASAIVFDDLVKVKWGLPIQYWAKARWLMSPTVGLAISLIKDTTGNYIWRESTRAGEPGTLLGQPADFSSFAPATITTGLYTALFGDFSFYHIVDSLSFSMQRLNELYAENSQVGFIGRLETDGAPVLGDAFRRLKQA